MGTFIGQFVLSFALAGALKWVTHAPDPDRRPPPPAPPWATLHDDAPVRPFGPAPHDAGGALVRYVLKIHDADVRGERVEIKGTCVSACTLLLGARDVCVHRDAMLWFHAAYNPDTRAIDKGATRKMALYWGAPVAEWARSVGATESLAFTRRRALSGVEAIRLGVKACDV